MPKGTECIEPNCGVRFLNLIGTDYCDAGIDIDDGYDTKQCAWDGGDCE